MKPLKIGNIEIPVPVIQGGMGIGISLSGLASAVANMGGVGVISTVGIGFINRENNVSYKKNHILALKKEIQAAREKTKGILGVNIMSVLTNYAETVRASIEEGIDIIFSGAGLPLDLPKYLIKGSKTKLVPIISSARAAQIICTKWWHNFNYLPDAFVLEGPKAGGHLGFKPGDLNHLIESLEDILAEVLEVTKNIREKYNKVIPVIAAGGIFSGKDVYKIMQKGAAGVQMGTRFVATKECDASDEFKNSFVNASSEDIKIIKSPVGLPGRTINNSFLDEANDGKRRPKNCKYHCIKTCDPKTTSYCIAEALLQAYKGNLNDGFAFTGTNVGLINKISSVEEIFSLLQQEYQVAEKLEITNS